MTASERRSQSVPPPRLGSWATSRHRPRSAVQPARATGPPGGGEQERFGGFALRLALKVALGWRRDRPAFRPCGRMAATRQPSRLIALARVDGPHMDPPETSATGGCGTQVRGRAKARHEGRLARPGAGATPRQSCRDAVGTKDRSPPSLISLLLRAIRAGMAWHERGSLD